MWEGLSGWCRPGSPSRDAASWLSLRFSQSVETRRRYGWLKMALTRCAPLPASVWFPSGGGGTREAGGTVAESLVSLYRVGTHRIRQVGGLRSEAERVIDHNLYVLL
ncbi:unnamed protein product [Ascophyllum nodosum]